MSEFDRHIKNYRKKLDKSVALSGETSLFFAEYKAKKLSEWFKDLKYREIKILDYGCGDGAMANYVHNFFPHAEIYGIDPSKKSIEHASKKNTNINFKILENNEINFEPNSFDLIYAAGVFHHIPFEQHKHFFEQIIKVLKPGGSFVLFELNPYNPLTKLTFKNSPVDQNAKMLTPKYSRKLFASKTKTIYYFFFPAFLKKLRFLEKFICWLPIGALYACIVKKNKG